MEPKKFNRLLKNVKDEHSAKELYIFYFPKIVNRLHRQYGIQLAEDSAQEFFINLVKSSEKTTYINNPTSWVYTCVENIAKRKFYYENRYVELKEEISASKYETINEDNVFMEQVLSNLTAIEQTIIKMYYWEGCSQVEIANKLNLKATNVWKIHSRALKKLKKYLRMSVF